MDSMVLAATIRGGNASLESFSGNFKTSGRFQKKEDLIAKMLECLKKLNGVDQVILRCWMVYPKGNIPIWQSKNSDGTITSEPGTWSMCGATVPLQCSER